MKRFWEKVDKTPGLGPSGDCWEWTAGKFADGYGGFRLEGKTERAHRVSWLLEHGKWPRHNICHKCDNQVCVRPSHLFEGTHKDNAEDMKKKGRQQKGDTHAHALLTEKLVKDVVLPALNSGETCKSISERLNVTEWAIHDIKQKRTWRHI